MNSKSKITLSVILVMMLVAATAVIGVIVAWAARQQEFSSFIQVKYKAVGVTGQASARWKVANEASWHNMTAGGEADGTTVLTFGEKANESSSLSPTDKNIKLTSQNNYAVFEYKFTNSGGSDYAIDLFYTDDETQDANMSVFCINSDDEITADFKDKINIAYGDWTTTDISANGTKYVYILASISDIRRDAGYSGSFEFNLDGKDYSSDIEFDGAGTITGLKNDTLSVVRIPKEINGTPVTKIAAGAFADNAILTELVIPDSVEEIELGALNENCTNLKFISIPFVGRMKNQEIEDETHFGYIFGEGYSDDNYSALPTSLTNVIITGCTSIGDNAFKYCSGLTSIILPSSVTSIGDRSFLNCSGLKNITLPSGLESIGAQAFCYCIALTSIIIPSKVTTIGDYAFSFCSGLTNIIISSSVKYIMDQAFIMCSNLTEVTIESEYVYTEATSTSACGNLLENATTIKVLSSLVVDGHAYINETNFSNVTTESVGGKVYTVYRK